MSASARETLLTAAAAAGIVGAGGGGRPVGAGLTARPYRRLIVNAAQSEPLFAKDWAALAHFPDCVFDGARLVVEALGLAQAGIAVREEFLPHLPGLAARARAQARRLRPGQCREGTRRTRTGAGAGGDAPARPLSARLRSAFEA